MAELIVIIPEQALVLYVESDPLQNQNLLKFLQLDETNIRDLPNGDSFIYTLYNEESLRMLLYQKQNGFVWKGKHYFSNGIISANPDQGLQTTVQEVKDSVTFFNFQGI